MRHLFTFFLILSQFFTVIYSVACEKILIRFVCKILNTLVNRNARVGNTSCCGSATLSADHALTVSFTNVCVNKCCFRQNLTLTCAFTLSLLYFFGFMLENLQAHGYFWIYTYIYIFVCINKYLINAAFTNQNRNLSCLSRYLTFGDKLGHHCFPLHFHFTKLTSSSEWTYTSM